MFRGSFWFDTIQINKLGKKIVLNAILSTKPFDKDGTYRYNMRMRRKIHRTESMELKTDIKKS